MDNFFKETRRKNARTEEQKYGAVRFDEAVFAVRFGNQRGGLYARRAAGIPCLRRGRGTSALPGRMEGALLRILRRRKG